MTALERRAIGAFHVEDAVAPATLNRETFIGCLLPPVSAVQHLPHFVCHADQLGALRQGRPLVAPADLFKSPSPMVAIVDDVGTLLALAEPNREQASLQPRHVFCSEPG
jgi:tRNA U55 pseudouridine synthase TruB